MVVWVRFRKAHRDLSHRKTLLIGDYSDNLSICDHAPEVSMVHEVLVAYVVAVGVAFSLDFVLDIAAAFDDDAFAVHQMQYWRWELHEQ